jgi:hypothetical protein
MNANERECIKKRPGGASVILRSYGFSAGKEQTRLMPDQQAAMTIISLFAFIRVHSRTDFLFGAAR